MKELERLRQLADLTQDYRTRRLGKTHTLATRAKETGAKFVAINEIHGKYIKSEYGVEVISSLRPEKLAGYNGPIIIDPDAIAIALGEAIGVAEEFEKKLKEANKKLDRIKNIVIGV